MTHETLPAADWSLIPEHMHGAVQRYVDYGVQPGSFLTAVLTNDLRRACSRADDDNRHRLFQWMQFLHMYVPAACWGSPERYRAWAKRGGLRGVVEQKEEVT